MSYSRPRLTACLGLAAAGWTLGVTLLGGALRPGYSHLSQYISELGESGAANGGWVSLVGFAPIGVFVLGFLALAAPQLPASRWRNPAVVCLAFVGVAYLVAAVARCEPGCSGRSTAQLVHDSAGALEYLGAWLGLRLLYYVFRGSERWRPFALPCLYAGWLVIGGFLLMLSPGLESVRGLGQRIAELGIFGWIAWLSLELPRGGKESV